MTELSKSLASGPRDVLPVNAHGVPTRSAGAFHVSTDATLFSSSLPVLSHETLNAYGSNTGHKSLEDDSSGSIKLQQGMKYIDSHETWEIQDLESILPDDDELLADLTDDFDLSGLPGSLEELEEYDLFNTGGMELEKNSRESLSASMFKLDISEKFVENRTSQYSCTDGVGNYIGQRPHRQHPSRTLFVRNIDSNEEDLELQALFKQYGDIRSLDTACKQRGFVMISYYDVRAAQAAMRELHNKPLRRRILDIRYSIPKGNPSDKDMNQGTLVIFNVDPSVSNEELVQIFSPYGEVKEIRETPHRRHHRFIEFYDVRSAEAALEALNGAVIAGKCIKLEPSRPGGTRRNLILKFNQEFDQEKTRSSWHQAGSLIMNSPPGHQRPFHSTIERSPLQTIPQSSSLGTFASTCSNLLAGLDSILQSQVDNSKAVPSRCKDLGKGSHMEHQFSDAHSGYGVSFHKSYSLPEPQPSAYNSTMSSFRPLTSNRSGVEMLSGQQSLCGSPTLYTQQRNSSAWTKPVWSPYSSDKTHGHPYLGKSGPSVGLRPPHYQHHVGSAPLEVPLERHFNFFPKSTESSYIAPAAFGEKNILKNDGSFMMNKGAKAATSTGSTLPENMSEKGSGFELSSPPNVGPILSGSSPLLGFAASSIKGLSEWQRSRQMENNGSFKVDSQKQFQLDLHKIKSGEDTRTTLMIRNIPNKYTSKMLLAAIDENHKGTYDIFYLPIDFKNKCNVGYAFINMLSPAHIVPLYEEFNGKKWEKFNSEKIASLAYARIQGKTALVAHYQNSSLMNEAKRFRPYIFELGASKAGDQEHVCSNNFSINGQKSLAPGDPQEAL